MSVCVDILVCTCFDYTRIIFGTGVLSENKSVQRIFWYDTSLSGTGGLMQLQAECMVKLHVVEIRRTLPGKCTTADINSKYLFVLAKQQKTEILK